MEIAYLEKGEEKLKVADAILESKKGELCLTNKRVFFRERSGTGFVQLMKYEIELTDKVDFKISLWKKDPTPDSKAKIRIINDDSHTDFTIKGQTCNEIAKNFATAGKSQVTHIKKSGKSAQEVPEEKEEKEPEIKVSKEHQYEAIFVQSNPALLAIWKEVSTLVTFDEFCEMFKSEIVGVKTDLTEQKTGFPNADITQEVTVDTTDGVNKQIHLPTRQQMDQILAKNPMLNKLLHEMGEVKFWHLYIPLINRQGGPQANEIIADFYGPPEVDSSSIQARLKKIDPNLRVDDLFEPNEGEGEYRTGEIELISEGIIKNVNRHSETSLQYTQLISPDYQKKEIPRLEDISETDTINPIDLDVPETEVKEVLESEVDFCNQCRDLARRVQAYDAELTRPPTMELPNPFLVFGVLREFTLLDRGDMEFSIDELDLAGVPRTALETLKELQMKSQVILYHLWEGYTWDKKKRIKAPLFLEKVKELLKEVEYFDRYSYLQGMVTTISVPLKKAIDIYDKYLKYK